MTKRFILNAKNVGASDACNTAVKDGAENGWLKSISIDPMGDALVDVIDNIIPKYENLGTGIEINLTSGKFLCTDLTVLKGKESYLTLMFKALKPDNKTFMEELEREIRRQIERIMYKTKITHIDSVGYVHSIPRIFDMVCRLAKEYNISQVCTHFENFYIVPEIFRHTNGKFIKNFLKKFLLNFLTVFNENTVQTYGLETNDYLIGTSYADSMDGMSIMYSLKRIKGKNVTVQTDLYPCRYEDGTIDKHFDAYMLTKSQKLKTKIEKLGYNITNYVKEEPEEN